MGFMRLLLLFTLFLGVSFIPPIQAQIIDISLTNSKLKFERRDFYLDSVVDNRSDTTNIGEVLIGLSKKRVKINLKRGAKVEIKRYFNQFISAGPKLYPLNVSIDRLNISEYFKKHKEYGVIDISLGFFRKGRLVGYVDEKREYWDDNADVTQIHSKELAHVLKSCIRKYHEGRFRKDSTKQNSGGLNNDFLKLADSENGAHASQQNNLDSITISKWGIWEIYHHHGKDLNVKDIGQMVGDIPLADEQFKSHSVKNVIAMFMGGVGVLGGIGYALEKEVFTQATRELNTATLIAGSVGLVACVPLAISANKSLRNSVRSYNKKVNLSALDRYDIKFGMTRNGFTIGVDF
jgi:hypothetical protein